MEEDVLLVSFGTVDKSLNAALRSVFTLCIATDLMCDLSDCVGLIT